MSHPATNTPQTTPPNEPVSAVGPQARLQAAKTLTPPPAAPKPVSAMPASRQLSSSKDASYRRIVALVEAGQYEAALKAAQEKGSIDMRLRNAAGVCLLRLGRPAAAVQLFRPLVFAPDGLTLLRESPEVVRLNYATALLLDGRSAAYAEIIRHVDRALPGLQQLQRGLRAWQQSLGFWPRLGWRLGIGSQQSVTLDDPPGELL
jgi:hypothetical protein